ncbi:hypothetical protein FOZ63_009544 [Perkinsus olseni]|uniref:Uncharacterized protein n=1 Tax=Perkinsus olseni TaxID=32597 RepID=A0A7J6QVP1_PEROL|nr:hypothetical protein FOZ63_009544 [Perkinsus olseni]KAF4712172.1 hypothetical protein FOZ62_002113 [Perkinsus olseni]
MADPHDRPLSGICLVSLPTKALTDRPSSRQALGFPSLKCPRCGKPVTGELLPLGAYVKHLPNSRSATPSIAPSAASVTPALSRTPSLEPSERPVVSNTLLLPKAAPPPPSTRLPVVIVPNSLGVKSRVVSMRRCSLRPLIPRDPLGAPMPFRKGFIKGFSMTSAVCSHCDAVNGRYLQRLRGREGDTPRFDRWGTVLPASSAPPFKARKNNEPEQFSRFGSLPLYTEEILNPPSGRTTRERLETDRPEGYWTSYFTGEEPPVEIIDKTAFAWGRDERVGAQDRRRNAAKVAERARKRLAEASATDKETYAGPAVIEVRPVPGMQSDGVALEAYHHYPREHTAEHAASTANTARRRPSKGDAAPFRSNTLTEEAFESSPGEDRTGGEESRGDDAGGGRRFSRQFSIPRMYMTSRGVVEAGHGSGRSSNRSSRRNSRCDSAEGSRKNSDALGLLPGSRKGSNASANRALPPIGESRNVAPLKGSERGWRPQPVEGPSTRATVADVVDAAVLQRKALKSIPHVAAGGRRQSTGSPANKTLSGAINTSLPTDLTALAPPTSSRASHIMHSPPASRGSISAAGASRLIGQGIGSKLMGGGGQPRPSALDTILGPQMQERRRSLMMAAAAVLNEKGTTEGVRRWSTVSQNTEGEQQQQQQQQE